MKNRTILHLIAFLVLSVACQFAAVADEPQDKLWIIDPHTHFKGPEQIAEESKTTKYHPDNTLGHVVTPEDYRPVADRLGIQSTVVVEAVDQEHPAFNDWVLEQAKSDLISGYIARADLGKHDFLVNHRRYQSTGYLRGYRFRRDELQGYLDNEMARSNLKVLEQEGMVVDLLVDSVHSDSVTTLARDYPNLTIVIDHCFRARLQDGKVSPEWTKAVQDCGKYPNVHCKLSSLLNFHGTAPFTEQAPADLKDHEQ
ncbi:MAG: amidohydrolase family protein, partial [Planctomycetota bacterium]